MISAKTKALGRKLGKTARGIKNRVIDKTSDALSIIPRTKADMAKRTADYETGVIQKHRRIKKYGSADRRPPVDPDSDARTVLEYNRIKDKYKR